ncbi:NEQ516 [Nanoarchaeum equitans Kin4-M]|uniref:NEQ516 n=1 Tax=Nanoarchaeum equitans (strain Kin4-M) TaxID=228908 RepID=Q74MX1_NANEQ|nr:NEQ516 [Nanoarchaeum equitans Kin4-M]
MAEKEVLLQQILMQKQVLEAQLEEINNAIKEIEESNGKVYKILGTYFLEIPKEKALEELNEKKKLLEIRLDALKKQEEKLKGE